MHRELPRHALLEEACEPEPRPDPFTLSWLETFRRGVIEESQDALKLVRQLGLETPCVPRTT